MWLPDPDRAQSSSDVSMVNAELTSDDMDIGSLFVPRRDLGKVRFAVSRHYCADATDSLGRG